MLGDAFKNIWNICLKIYELDLVRFLTVLRLAWEAALKNTIVKLDHLTDIDMLLMVKKNICHAIYCYVEASNNYMKSYD